MIFGRFLVQISQPEGGRGTLTRVIMTDLAQKVSKRVPVWPLVLVLASTGSGAFGQQGAADLPQAPTPAPSVLAVKFPGGVTVDRATTGALPLSLDEAIERGLQHNLQVQLAQENELSVHGQILSVGNALLPNLTAVARTQAQEFNLAAIGFTPFSLAMAGVPPGTFREIVTVDTASAQLKMSQALFNVPAYYLFRAAQKTELGAQLNTLNARGELVLAVGTQYLRALADASQIENARALEKADEEVLRQASASHDAGVGTNLDVLRARVQLQTQQQVLINAENAFEKDKISLNRLIGLPAEQELTLTDTAPYAEYAELPLQQALAVAYERRKDLLILQAELEVADRTRKAVKYERIPVLSFDGFYGVVGEINGLYHGVFNAEGKLSVPIFQEAQLRGEQEVSVAQMTALRQHIASLKVSIDAQIRSSMMDVESSKELVKVARSNVDLATEELQQATDRFSAGVDDNLAVVQAQSTLSAAQTRLVQTLYEYNQSKLELARDTGVVETQYKVYLGR
jgi:outer membrane protein TolC